VSRTGICRFADRLRRVSFTFGAPGRAKEGKLPCQSQKQSKEHNAIKKKENRHRLRRESLYAKRFIMCARESTEHGQCSKQLQSVYRKRDAQA